MILVHDSLGLGTAVDTSTYFHILSDTLDMAGAHSDHTLKLAGNVTS